MTVELTEQEWTVLLNCAALGPYRDVAQVIQKAIQQIQTAKKDMPPPSDG